LKNETYRCQGGINQKISLYIANSGEFLNLQNVDFRVIGALSSFAGSATYTTVGSTSAITGVAGYNSGGASTAVITTDLYNVSNVSGSTFSNLLPYIYGGNAAFTAFANGGTAVFGCNGYDFWTFQGSSLCWQYSLGKPHIGAFRQTVSGAGAGPSGIIVLYSSLVRSDGLVGPSVGITFSCFGETRLILSPASSPNLAIGLSTGFSNGSFGLSGIRLWMQLNNNLPLAYGTSFAPTFAGVSAGFSNALLPLNTTGVTITFDYTSIGFWGPPDFPPYDFQGSFAFGGAGPNQGGGITAIGYAGNYNPTIIESYANQLFLSGVAITPSRVFYSNPGTPEVIDYQNFFDVSNQDTTGVSALKSFFGSLVIWKSNSTWVLTGTGIETFVLTNVSPIYGCLSFRAACVFNQNLWFLDRKGIFEFNGANVNCISTKMQPYFDVMNVQAAQTQAIMIHVKERNEIWCAIPINGSTVNNIILVYDYLAGGWTTRTCPPNTLTAMQTLPLGQSASVTYYGTTTGIIGTIGSSLVGDSGVGNTIQIKSHFIDDLGNSVTKMYRRLYVDATVPAGVTYAIAVNLYADKSLAAPYSTTMILSSFQNRIDFGLPAKSVAIELLYNGATFFQMSGFTLEYRYQRNV